MRITGPAERATMKAYYEAHKPEHNARTFLAGVEHHYTQAVVQAKIEEIGMLEAHIFFKALRSTDRKKAVKARAKARGQVEEIVRAAVEGVLQQIKEAKFDQNLI